MSKSDLERTFANQIRLAGLPEPVAEYRFHATRRWRFDFAYPDLKLAVEIEGGIWRRGRHNRASGFVRDAEKYNEAAIAGCMQRCNTGSRDFAWWEGYRAALLWVLHLIDKPDIDEDPMLTVEEREDWVSR